MLRVLFVCTGNTCRSPMAEALLKKTINQSGEHSRIAVMSAGLASPGAYPASDGARRAMTARNISLDTHCSRQVEPQDIRAADLVLTMTASHKRALIGLLPEEAGKIHTLADYAGEPADISDPYGGSGEEYDQCAAQIEKLLAKIWEKIVVLAGKKTQAREKMTE